MTEPHVSKKELQKEIKRLRKELAAARQKGASTIFFGELVESIPHPVFCKDVSGRFIYANKSYCEHTGVALHEVLGKDDFYLHSWEAAEKYRADDRNVLESREVFRCVEKNVLLESSGRTTWTQVVKAPLYGSSGAVVGVMGLFWDVSDQKNIETALRRSEEKYRSVIENIKDVYYRTDRNGVVTLVSPSVVKLLEVDSVHDVLGARVAVLYYHPREWDVFWNVLHEHDGVEDYELTLVNAHGDPVPVATSSSFYRDEEGRVLGVEGVLRDIRERKRTEQLLRESESNLREILEHSPLPMFVVSMEGDVLYLNSRFTRVFGYAREEVPNLETWWQLASLDDETCKNATEQSYGDLKHHASGVKTLSGEYVVRNRNGEIHHVQVTGSVINGQVVVMFSDVTRLKEAEATLLRAREDLEVRVQERTWELQHANAELKRMDKQKNLFLSSASHELRTPLTSIMGFSKLIKKDAVRMVDGCLPQESSFRDIVSRIIGNASIISTESERLARLINDLLDLNKIEAGKMDWHDELVNLDQLVLEVVESIQVQIDDEHDLELIFERGASSGEAEAERILNVYADPDRIKQVLLNLLDNSIKFTSQGRVVVSTAFVPGSGGAEVPGGMVELRVQDSGEGISSDELTHIFDKYYQSVLSVMKPQGTGLGLSICKQIVEHYKGSIGASSELGKGTTFVVRLPMTSLPLHEEAGYVGVLRGTVVGDGRKFSKKHA